MLKILGPLFYGSGENNAPLCKEELADYFYISLFIIGHVICDKIITAILSK